MGMTEITSDTLNQIDADAIKKMEGACEKSSMLAMMKGQTITGAGGALPGVSDSWGGYSLEAPAKSLVPFESPERNRIPRVIKSNGSVAHFRTINSIGLSGGLGRLEGKRGSSITYNLSTSTFPYKSYGVQDSITEELRRTAVGTEGDLFAKQHTFALLRMMTQEELLIVGGQGTTALPAIGTPTGLTANPTGGTIAAGTYSIKVAALNMNASNPMPALNFGTQSTNISLYGTGVANATTPSIGGAINYVANALNGVGAASASFSTGALSGSTNAISATVTPVSGALAYAWYVGVAGSETLQIVTAFPSMTITQLVTGGDAVSTVTNDGTLDPLVFDGYIPQILNASGYYKNGYAAALTKSAGGVKELDDCNSYVYRNFKLGPSRYLCGEQFYRDLSNAILSTASGAVAAQTVMVVNNDAGTKSNLIMSGRVASYINKSYPSKEITIEVHPWLPPSTCIAIVDTIPYPSADIPRAMEMELAMDYWAQDYMPQSPTWEFGISAFGALKMYAPRFCGVLTGFLPGLQG